MVWINFPLYAIIIISLWIAGIILLYLKNSKLNLLGGILLSAGILVFIFYIFILWTTLDRPPLRTLGETRLWYSLFMAIIGSVFFLRWKYKWFLAFAVSLASLFLALNILHPENFNKTLMPALLSPWFVPHVIVYIFAYASLGASSLVALRILITLNKKSTDDLFVMADNLVYIGFAFLTLGLLFGALWAKEAWGHYWTWDPKETCAFLTWSVYLIYIHLRKRNDINTKTSTWVLVIAFAVLLVCWFGVNYLPAASNSVHTYSTYK